MSKRVEIDKNDQGAELIHQPIPDVDGTEPRLNTAEQLLLGELRSVCSRPASGGPCIQCGQASIMHSFKRILADATQANGDTYARILASWQEQDACLQKINAVCWTDNDPGNESAA